MQLDRKKFKKLPLALRYKTVEEEGEYITCRIHLNYSIELFQLKGQYVEVWRSKATNQIYWIECCDTGHIADIYVQDFNFSALFN